MRIDHENQRTISNIVDSAMPKDAGFTAIKLSQRICNLYGLSIDWHVISFVLDDAYTAGRLGISGHNADGMTEYYIK